MGPWVIARSHPPVRVVLLERNKMVGRRIGRIFGCAGLEPVLLDDPAALPEALDGAAVVAADAFDGDLVTSALRDNPQLRGFLWTAEPLDRLLRYVVDEPRISNIFGRPSFEASPREWELLLVGRRLAEPKKEAPTFPRYLSWGSSSIELSVHTSEKLGDAVAKVQELIAGIGVPSRVSAMFGELSHELLMNALYDAPVDAAGRPRFAHQRKAPVAVSEREGAKLRLACDGVRLCIQVTDPFGRLERAHVFNSLARGLKNGEMDKTNGGAGLGVVVCHNASIALFYDVIRGKKTEVTAFFDLDLNLREFRTQAKSLHFFRN